MTSRFAAALGCVLSCLAPLSALADNRHPLDPLSWQEQWAALEVLLDAGKIGLSGGIYDLQSGRVTFLNN